MIWVAPLKRLMVQIHPLGLISQWTAIAETGGASPMKPFSWEGGCG